MPVSKVSVAVAVWGIHVEVDAARFFLDRANPRKPEAEEAAWWAAAETEPLQALERRH